MSDNDKEFFHDIYFHDIYKEIKDEIGIEAALKIFDMFKGQQITFPVKLYDTKKLKDVIVSEFNGTNFRDLAKKYGYSEKTIRRMIKESSED